MDDKTLQAMKKPLQYSEAIKEALNIHKYESTTEFISQEKFNGKGHFIAGFNAALDYVKSHAIVIPSCFGLEKEKTI